MRIVDYTEDSELEDPATLGFSGFDQIPRNVDYEFVVVGSFYDSASESSRFKNLSSDSTVTLTGIDDTDYTLTYDSVRDSFTVRIPDAHTSVTVDYEYTGDYGTIDDTDTVTVEYVSTGIVFSVENQTTITVGQSLLLTLEGQTSEGELFDITSEANFYVDTEDQAVLSVVELNNEEFVEGLEVGSGRIRYESLPESEYNFGGSSLIYVE